MNQFLRKSLPLSAIVLFTHSASAAALTTQPSAIPPSTTSQRLQSLLGLFVFLMVAFLIGRLRGHRKLIPMRMLGWGLALQFCFGLVVVKNRAFLIAINDAVDALLGFTAQGAHLVFGNLSALRGPAVTSADGLTIGWATDVGYFAFFVLPTIIFFACLTAVLYHIGIMQYVVQGLAWIMSRTMKTSGAETLSSAANIFVGQTEAPLMVKPFIAAATQSELMAIMVGGFANIASGVLGLYTVWLRPFIPDAAGHLAAACFITAPGSLLIAKLMVPETETPQTSGGVQFKVERIDANLLDAATRGTTEGLGLALNVGAMLITFTALVALVNALLTWTSAHVGLRPISLEVILGYIFRPFAWLTGVNWIESQRVGSLLGIKTVLNELIAYSDMKDHLTADAMYLSPRAALLATYALCGFANFASVGIQVGGISTLAPTRRHDLSRIGLLAMVGGALASLMAACVVGILV
ncbi:MAG TPA: nucleoside transporter C-terminal domain-containing protein [Tepidisphaeraceae bacterium]|jgi:CNT family concentrative nucleoside transporter